MDATNKIDGWHDAREWLLQNYSEYHTTTEICAAMDDQISVVASQPTAPTEDDKAMTHAIAHGVSWMRQNADGTRTHIPYEEVYASQPAAVSAPSDADRELEIYKTVYGALPEGWEFARAAAPVSAQPQAMTEGWVLVPQRFLSDVYRANRVASSYSPTIDAIDEAGGDDAEDPMHRLHYILHYACARLSVFKAETPSSPGRLIPSTAAAPPSPQPVAESVPTNDQVYAEVCRQRALVSGNHYVSTNAVNDVMAAVRALQPVARQDAGGVKIRTWQERTGNHNWRPGSVKHALAEIAELRAALPTAPAIEPVAGLTDAEILLLTCKHTGKRINLAVAECFEHIDFARAIERRLTGNAGAKGESK